MIDERQFALELLPRMVDAYLTLVDALYYASVFFHNLFSLSTLSFQLYFVLSHNINSRRPFFLTLHLDFHYYYY